MTEEHFDGEKFAASFEEETINVNAIRDVCSNGVVTAFFRQSLFDTLTARNRAAQDLLIYRLRYRRVLSRIFIQTDKDVSEKKGKIVHAQERLLIQIGVVGNWKNHSRGRIKMYLFRC